MSAKIAIKQNPGNEIPTEVLATDIVAIAEGMRKLRAGRMKDEALFLLIQHGFSLKGRPSIRTIKALFDVIADLERMYIKPAIAKEPK